MEKISGFKITSMRLSGFKSYAQDTELTFSDLTSITGGNGRGKSNAYIEGTGVDVGADIFRRGLCLPSDNKMTPEQQDLVIEIIHRCFR